MERYLSLIHQVQIESSKCQTLHTSRLMGYIRTGLNYTELLLQVHLTAVNLDLCPLVFKCLSWFVSLFVFLISSLTSPHYFLSLSSPVSLSLLFVLLHLRRAHLAGLRVRDAAGIKSAGDETMRVISASSDIDDVALLVFFVCFF